MREFHSVSDFYPFYLSQHRDKVCRRMHFVGSALVLMILAISLLMATWKGIPLALFLGYGFAWIGHFCFEKNKPATFEYPFYSFICDWLMFRDILLGRISI